MATGNRQHAEKPTATHLKYENIPQTDEKKLQHDESEMRTRSDAMCKL